MRNREYFLSLILSTSLWKRKSIHRRHVSGNCRWKWIWKILISTLIHISLEEHEGRSQRYLGAKRSTIFSTFCTPASSGISWKRIGMKSTGPRYTSGTIAGVRTGATRICLRRVYRCCLKRTNLISQSSMAMVPTPWQKRGRERWVFGTQTSKRNKRADHSGKPWIRHRAARRSAGQCPWQCPLADEFERTCRHGRPHWIWSWSIFAHLGFGIWQRTKQSLHPTAWNNASH